MKVYMTSGHQQELNVLCSSNRLDSPVGRQTNCLANTDMRSNMFQFKVNYIK